jgi:pimeloyl-ACP methyl ester carboxylesterase
MQPVPAKNRLAWNRLARTRFGLPPQLRSSLRTNVGDRLRPAWQRPAAGPVRAAVLVSRPLPELTPDLPAWPVEHLVVDGVRFAYRPTPGPIDAEPAVYVPGLGGSGTNWTDCAALLSGSVAGESVDLAGFGLSEPPADGDYSPRAHARLLARFIETRGRGPVHLLGNSLGGVITLVLAATRPDLVRSLTLVSPAMPDLRPHGRERMLLAATAVPGVFTLTERRAGIGPEQHVRMVLETVFGDPSVATPRRIAEAVAEAEAHAATPWAITAMRSSLRGLIASYVGPGGRSLWRMARRVSVPSLVVWGDRDRLVQVGLAGRTARALPDGRLLVLPGIGHVAHMEAPQLVSRAVLGLFDDAASRRRISSGAPS